MADSRNTKPALQRTHRLSWMLSGWLRSAVLRADGGGTACMALGCPDDFVAVRLGLPNISNDPWRISRIIGRASTSFNNYVTPTGDSPWVPFTACHQGEDKPDIVCSLDGPHEIQIRGLTGSRLDQAARVCWTWTDWVPLRSVAPDPATGMRVLMLRAFIPPDQTVTFANGQLRRFIGDAETNLGYEVFSGGIKFNTDLVTHPDAPCPPWSSTWLDNHLTPGTNFPLVQFLTRKPGITGIVVGDSHAQGTGTTEQFRNYGYCATSALIARHRQTVPFGVVNCAQGGLGSEPFFARLETLIDAVRPSYALLPGWTYNDSRSGVQADQHCVDLFLARLVSMIELCRHKGVVPILLTPFPRDRASMEATQLLPWQRLREDLLQLGTTTGITVIDATLRIGNVCNGMLDGTYQPALSKDHIHPNDLGHEAIGQMITEVINSLL